MKSDLLLGFFITGGCIVIFMICMISLPLTAMEEEKTVANCKLRCNGTQPSFYIIPFSTKDHRKVTFSLEQTNFWISGMKVGLYNPLEGGKSDFISSGFRGFNERAVSKEQILATEFISLSCGSVINVAFNASRSLLVMVHSRKDIISLPDDDSYLRESDVMGYQLLNFDKKIVDKALFKSQSRELNFTLTVNETSQYVISFANDSPFYSKIEDFRLQWQSRSPITGIPLSSCLTERPNCTLEVPEDYESDYVSLVVYSNCADQKMTTSDVTFDASRSNIVANWLGFGIPMGVGVLFCLAGFFVLFFYDGIKQRRRRRLRAERFDSEAKPLI